MFKTATLLAFAFGWAFGSKETPFHKRIFVTFIMQCATMALFGMLHNATQIVDLDFYPAP